MRGALSTTFAWPLGSHRMRLRTHLAIDLNVQQGSEVVAARKGSLRNVQKIHFNPEVTVPMRGARSRGSSVSE